MAAPKQAFYLHYSESSFINPSPLTCFFFILVKHENKMASPQSQVTRQGFQGQKPSLQKEQTVQIATWTTRQRPNWVQLMLLKLSLHQATVYHL